MSGEQNSSEVGVLTQRVSALETGQKDIVSELRSIGAQLAERSRTPWGLIVSIIGTGVVVIGTIAGLALRPMSESQGRLETGILALGSKIETVDRRDDAQRVVEDRFKRAEADIDALQKALVPRGEHERQWADQRRLDDGQADQIKELRHRLENDYMPKEALDMLLRRVDEVERRVNTRGG